MRGRRKTEEEQITLSARKARRSLGFVVRNQFKIIQMRFIQIVINARKMQPIKCHINNANFIFIVM